MFYHLELVFVIAAIRLQVPWGGVILLPFVDEETLERMALPVLNRLPPEVLQRNRVGKVVLLMRKQQEQRRTEAQRQQWACGPDIGARLSVLDSIYQSEFLFFKHKVLSKRHDVAIDLFHLLDWLNDTSKQQRLAGKQVASPSVFLSSLPYAFPDILDSCVVEEEVLVLPPGLVARLDQARALNILKQLGIDVEAHQTQQHGDSRSASDACVELLVSALKTGSPRVEQGCLGGTGQLPPTPYLHPFEHELLYPTAPLPGLCTNADVLTPSLHVKCFAVSYPPVTVLESPSAV